MFSTFCCPTFSILKCLEKYTDNNRYTTQVLISESHALLFWPWMPNFFTWRVDLSHVASAKVSSAEWQRNRTHCLTWLHQGTLLTARRDQKQIKLLDKIDVTEVKKAKVRILESCEIWEQQMEPNSLGLLVKGSTCSLVFYLGRG